jgi:hypothetical protein
MLLNSSPLRVLRRYTYTPEDQAAALRSTGLGEKVIAWQDGSLVEAVELYDEANGSILSNVTIPQTADVEAAAMGEVGNCVLEASVEKIGYGSNGQTRDKIKWRLVGFAPLAAETAKANGRQTAAA